MVGAPVRGIERKKEVERLLSAAKDLSLFFNTCTSSNIEIIIYLINVVYSAQVGGRMNASDCTVCVCVPLSVHVCP